MGNNSNNNNKPRPTYSTSGGEHARVSLFFYLRDLLSEFGRHRLKTFKLFVYNLFTSFTKKTFVIAISIIPVYGL